MAPKKQPTLTADNTTSPLFFYSTNEKPYGIFSQWYRRTFNDPSNPSITFNCAEQYMMHSKAMLFADHATAAKILATSSSSQQKKLGRQVKNYDEAIWQTERLGIVEKGNYFKFGQNEELKAVLLGTGERELVEAAANDGIWGIGFDAKQAVGISREKWGLNLLGIALMNVRKRIRDEEAADDDSGDEPEHASGDDSEHDSDDKPSKDGFEAGFEDGGEDDDDEGGSDDTSEETSGSNTDDTHHQIQRQTSLRQQAHFSHLRQQNPQAQQVLETLQERQQQQQQTPDSTPELARFRQERLERLQREAQRRIALDLQTPTRHGTRAFPEGFSAMKRKVSPVTPTFGAEESPTSKKARRGRR